jgi:hypothetical protein
MLLEFSLSNFLSIKDEITLSMIASNDKLLDKNTIKYNKLMLLKSAAIYGPNASGKTNILYALYYVTDLIINSHRIQSGETLDYRPFKLDKKYETNPSRFKIVLEIDSIKYIYEFSLDEDKIYQEKLWYFPPPHYRKRVIFSRDITRGDKVYKFPEKDEKMLNIIKDNTRNNMLFLSRSANMNYEKTSLVVDWFTKNIRTMFPENDLIPGIYTKKALAADESKKTTIRNILTKADSGIVGIDVKERSFNDDFLKEFPKELRDMILEEERKAVEIIHAGLDNEGNKIEVRFRFEEEAKGTRKMFNLAGPIMDALANGRLLTIDEIETSLHPILVRYLINLFNDPRYNKLGAQLIFTTHNTHLMHQTILRRDQMWLTEKGGDQGTRLLSICEFRVRPDENIEKGYLLGRYGAIPNPE